jgi:uncharacterized protein
MDAAALTVLALADEISPGLYDHFQPDRWRHVDLVLSSGDLPPEYLDFIASQLNVPLVYVRGNHDGQYDSSRYDGFLNAHARVVNIRGIRIAGFEGCRRYNEGLCQYTELEMRRIVRRTGLRTVLRGRPQIILAHAPPAGCHDGTDPAHRGFDCFVEAIDNWLPAFFVHGHTHNYYGKENVTIRGSTTVINAFPYRVFKVNVPEPSTERDQASPANGPPAGTL